MLFLLVFRLAITILLYLLLNILLIYCFSCNVQVQENIFVESNRSIKSIQVMLDALNELRLFYVMERTTSSSIPLKRETSRVSIF